MNTTFHLEIICLKNEERRAETALRGCHKTLSELESELSEFLPQSPVYRLNQTKPGTWIPVTDHFVKLYRLSRYVMEITEKSFDCFVKSSSPNPNVDCSSGVARRTDDGTHLGFGAIGKGFAIDCVREEIHREGFNNYSLSAGGSSIAISGTRGKTPWQLDWTWQPGLAVRLTHANTTSMTVGISGTQTQRDHILSSKTRASTRPRTSALVGHPSAALSDALSTALFVSGMEKCDRLASLVDPPALAAIELDQTPKWNGVFQNLWGGLSSFALTLFFSARVWADEVIDFSDSVDFNPYIGEKNRLWILVPLLTLAFVFLHLVQPREKP